MPTSTFRNMPNSSGDTGLTWEVLYFSSLYFKSWEQDEEHSTVSPSFSTSNHCIASIYIFLYTWASPRENQLYIWKEHYSLFKWFQDREFQAIAYSHVNINWSTNRSQLWHEPSHCQMTQSKSAHRNLYCCCCINTDRHCWHCITPPLLFVLTK